MSKRIIVDSGYWFALFDERDKFHEVAQILEEDMQYHTLVVPWPVLYESINTRFVRREHNLKRLQKFLQLPSTVLIEDQPYRAASLDFIIEKQKFQYSLVDHVIRSIIADDKMSIDALVSFNPKDFHDVCNSRGVEMLYAE